MITTSEIAPSPFLSPYVRCYAYRQFDTQGRDIIKPWHACYEISIPFFFQALPVKLVDPDTGEILKTGEYTGIVGLPTQYNGNMILNGSYAFLEIMFRPNGFHKIFGIPTGEVNNKIFGGDEIFGKDINILFEQLCNADGLAAMALLIDTFLTKYLKMQKTIFERDAISYSADFIVKHAGRVNIEKLAGLTNMSMRNFERRFTASLGFSPKLFCCITRFHHAFTLKLKNPEMEWSHVAYQSGYYDQMHLIKDFKKFSGATPGYFFNQTPLSRESFISKIDG